MGSPHGPWQAPGCVPDQQRHLNKLGWERTRCARPRWEGGRPGGHGRITGASVHPLLNAG